MGKDIWGFRVGEDWGFFRALHMQRKGSKEMARAMALDLGTKKVVCKMRLGRAESPFYNDLLSRTKSHWGDTWTNGKGLFRQLVTCLVVSL